LWLYAGAAERIGIKKAPDIIRSFLIMGDDVPLQPYGVPGGASGVLLPCGDKDVGDHQFVHVPGRLRFRMRKQQL
jgi:hypothetical protein